jgi:hypothetical protein
MMKWMTCLVLVLCACGCNQTNDLLRGRSVSQVDLFDQKINRHTVITNAMHITTITNQVAQLTHGWRKNWITLPSPYWSLTFKEGTNSVGTLFVGANWMSYGNLIRTSTPEENGDLWQAVSQQPAQQPLPQVQK